MTKLNAKKFAETLTGMGFFVRDTTVRNGVDDHTTLADSFTATIDTENGLFEMVVTDSMIVANKPNGTQRYWDNLTDARARQYVRQVLDFNKPLPKPEPEVEETQQAETPEREAERDAARTAIDLYEAGNLLVDVEAARAKLAELEGVTPADHEDPWVSEGNVRRIVEEAARDYAGFVRHDLDAINEGWDALSYPDSGYLYEHCLNVLESGLGDGEVLPDEALDWLADATYSVLCPEEGDDGTADGCGRDAWRVTVADSAWADPVTAVIGTFSRQAEAEDAYALAEGDATDPTTWVRLEEMADGGKWVVVAWSQCAEEGPEFADLTPGQLDYVENAGSVTHGTVPEQVARVARELGLDGMSERGLRAVRNAVVRHLGDLMTEARDAGDWEAFDRLSRNMGGICEAIDRILPGVAA